METAPATGHSLPGHAGWSRSDGTFRRAGTTRDRRHAAVGSIARSAGSAAWIVEQGAAPVTNDRVTFGPGVATGAARNAWIVAQVGAAAGTAAGRIFIDNDNQIADIDRQDNI